MNTKRILFGLGICATIAFAHINVNFSSSKGIFDNLMLANIEALANSESITSEELAKLGCEATIEPTKCPLPNGQTMRYAQPIKKEN